MYYKDKYNYWLTNKYFDKKTKEELLLIQNNDIEIKERFYKDLEFGTGGLRGILGAGTNRLNIYVIRRATQGFANYILNQEYKGKNPKAMGICIAYDTRNMSKEFAEETALVFNANGIKTYIYNECRPTPQLSFTIRYLNCAGGVVITASHNPPEYNGYKVYGCDGAQIPSPKDKDLISYVNKIKNFGEIKIIGKEESIKKGLYNILDESLDNEFLKNALSQSINVDVIKQVADTLKIVYTPLHGTGNKPVKNLLNQAGFKNVNIVKKQELPDGNFSTVEYPNPEDPKAFNLAINTAKDIGADIIIGTDPDADRVGVVVKDSNENYITLNGNMIGTLLAEYILSQKKANNTLPDNATIISSIVSTSLTKEIAKQYKVKYVEVLTGFKYIGEIINNFEEEGSYQYIFGFEESYGYLSGTYTRDKDAVASSLLICEMAAYYKCKKMSLYDGLIELYQKYGYFKELTEFITLKGIKGIKTIEKIMQVFNTNYPKDINGIKITEYNNYKTGIQKNLLTNEEYNLTLPVSNVLYFTLEDKSWFCIRPSGTEPKLKIYIGVKGNTQEDANNKVNDMKNTIMQIIKSI